VCYGGTDVGSASISGRVRHRPVGRDHQGSWDANSGANSYNESKLHGTQIPSNQAAPIQQGELLFSLRSVNVTDLSQVFRKASPEAIDLIAALLEYTPTQRLSAIDAMCHPFFDEIRDPNCRFPDSRHPNAAPKDMPKLFDFSRHGVYPRPSIRLATLTEV